MQGIFSRLGADFYRCAHKGQRRTPRSTEHLLEDQCAGTAVVAVIVGDPVIFTDDGGE